jgi:hypothetical protein
MPISSGGIKGPVTSGAHLLYEHTIKKTLLPIVLFLSLFSVTTQSIELEKAVKMLEMAGDVAAAEVVTFKLTQERKNDHWRIEFLRKYPNSDYVEMVYMQAWKGINGSENTARLTSFVKAYPAGEYSLLALDQLLQEYQKENTILGYKEYLNTFPNTPRAIKAMNGIYQVAYERVNELAQDEDRVGFYDEYIKAFPASPLRDKAIDNMLWDHSL